METEYELAESDSEGESESEAAEARRWTPPRRASGAGLYRPPMKMNGAGVSQAQLAAAMARVGDQLKQNSAAVSTVNSRVNTVSGAEKKDNQKREKDIKAINDKIQLLTLLPLLIQPTYTIKANSITDSNADTSPATDTKLTSDPASTTNALLPLLLIGGLGGGSSTGSGSDSGMDNTTLLILALVLSGGFH